MARKLRKATVNDVRDVVRKKLRSIFGDVHLCKEFAHLTERQIGLGIARALQEVPKEIDDGET